MKVSTTCDGFSKKVDVPLLDVTPEVFSNEGTTGADESNDSEYGTPLESTGEARVVFTA